MKLTIIKDKLYHGEDELGPTTTLFVDANEKPSIIEEGVISSSYNPDRIDYIFVSKDRVVGVESKTLNDLTSSWISGRLQRQLRTLYESVDIPVLMLRGIGGNDNYKSLSEFPSLMDDLLKFQLMGTSTTTGLLLFSAKHDTYSALVSLKEILDGKKSLRTVVSRYETKKVKGTKREKILQLTIKGVGPIMAKKLAEGVGSLKEILNTTEGKLKKAGANKTVLASIRSLKR